MIHISGPGSRIESLRSGLTMRLSVIGLPPYMINPFVDLLIRWSTCSGEEWTVGRCKALKTYLLQLRSGMKPGALFAKNRHGQLRGVVGSITRYGMKSDKCLKQALNAFMAYSNWVSVNTTPTQRKKFLCAINANSVAIPGDLENALVGVTRSVVGMRTIRDEPKPLMEWIGSPSKRAPTLRYGSVPQDQHMLYELMLVSNVETWEHILRYWTIYSPVFKGLDVKGFVDSLHEDSLSYGPMVAGEVHFLQEPGYKLRSIASPFRLFQVASEPLKNDLGRLVASLEWDCTHDQGRAFPIIQERLSWHKKVYSVDLSNATDYFPWQLQYSVLRTVYGVNNPYVEMFREISRCTWRSELGVLQWKRGQPLGFNPSFFTFTLTHGLLLRSLLGRPWNHEFYVVGDDVVILDDLLYDKYIRCLQMLECPWSPDKTLVSDELCEFVGKVVTATQIIPLLKWREISDDNFLDLARWLGPRIRLMLSQKQKRVLDVFAHVPDFIHPYGLNWSYPGSNLELMIKQGLQLCFEQRVLNSLTGLSQNIHRQLYADYRFLTQDLSDVPNQEHLRQIVETFDEKVKSVFLKAGFARKNYEYFLEGLKDIPVTLSEAKQRPLELPLEVKPPSRVTLLQRLSQFLRKGLKQEPH